MECNLLMPCINRTPGLLLNLRSCISSVPVQCFLPQQSRFGPASKGWTEYAYLHKSSQMVGLSPIMCTIKFIISVKCLFICIFLQKVSCGTVSIDQIGQVLIIKDVFHNPFHCGFKPATDSVAQF